MQDIDAAGGQGRLAIITGAAGGQGRALAVALGRRAYRLGLIDRDASRLAALESQLAAEGIEAATSAIDIADRPAMRTAVDGFADRFGPPFVLAATAAILRPGPVLEPDDDAFAETLRVNVLGTLVAATEAARLMVAAGRGGRILNWSSVSSRHGSATHPAYCASKSAVESLTRSLAAALAPHGITVNAILPGSIDTDMLGHLDADERRRVAEGIPLGRWGTPEDIAATALHLLSDEAGWITGADFVVDGGLVAISGPPNLADSAAAGGGQAR